MSCSDKIAKWNILGIQGSLIMNFLEKPIYFAHIIIGSCPYNEDVMQRALFKRFDVKKVQISPFKQQNDIKISQSDLEFKFSKPASSNELQPAPSSIIWCDCPSKQLEVAVEGRKQGVTKKTQNRPTSRLEISKKNLFQSFAFIVKSAQILPSHLQSCLPIIDTLTYHQAKQLSLDYETCWEAVRTKVMPTWSYKPTKLIEFLIKDE